MFYWQLGFSLNFCSSLCYSILQAIFGFPSLCNVIQYYICTLFGFIGFLFNCMSLVFRLCCVFTSLVCLFHLGRKRKLANRNTEFYMLVHIRFIQHWTKFLHHIIASLSLAANMILLNFTLWCLHELLHTTIYAFCISFCLLPYLGELLLPLLCFSFLYLIHF